MKSLILVESPTKASTLARFLGEKYDIQASMGHIRDLPKGSFGVDIKHDFKPSYVIPKDKRKIIERLKEQIKNVNHVILATDPDREGEAISFHLKEVLSDENKKAKFDRIVFHEITPAAINEALDRPREIDMNLVHAQTGRRVLDRIVGYKISPILWMKIKKGLSAGRVQSIALRLIVEREREIEKFNSKEFYRVFVIANKKEESHPITFELVKINDEPIEKTTTLTLYDGEYKYAETKLSITDAESIKNDLSGKNLKVLEVTQKETKRAPYPPFTTSLLQIEAARRFGYTSKRTMSLAQKLYEEGFITYHRTDSYNLSNVFISAARNYIEKNFGKKYLPRSPRIYHTKSKLAQEAHEAIRPTNLFEDEKAVAPKLGSDYARLYGLIYKRALSTQMADAVFLSTHVDAQIKNGKTYDFVANGRVMKFDGFLKIWFYEDEEQLIPDLEKDENLDIKEVNITTHNTNPPPRYNEASLISSLEKHGIGRPSTYAPIISTIEARFYVEKEENRFKPTEIGILVNDFLVKNFSTIDDIPFTAKMEDELDDVANGTITWISVLKEFYEPLKKHLKDAEEEKKIKIELERTGEKCPLDGGDIVIRVGRFGKFKACSNFPKCEFKESFAQESGYLCPRDQGKMVVKRTHRGRTFYGCENYPKCDFAVWTKAQLVKQAIQNKSALPEKSELEKASKPETLSSSEATAN